MTRSATTGIYTRLSNSFSQPVTGTTIDPTDADSYFDDIDLAMNSFVGTSTTSLAIGTGSKSFTSQTTKSFLVGSFIQAFSQADHANYMYGSVTSYDTGTGVVVVNVTTTGGAGTLADWLLFTAGAQGAVGSTGATGPVAGIKQAYSTTTADADPGAGIFRLNNATPASATAAYLDNLDSGGATVSTIFDLWDDSTTTTKGYVRFEKTTDPTVWAQFAVTGSVVDGTGYRKLTLGSGSGSGAFTNADTFAILFYRSGDKGTDGAGTGDFSSNTASSVDGEMLLFSGTAGKTGKRSTLTGGVLKSTSGVPAITTTSDALTIGTIELGAASDTTISRSSAGVIAVEGVTVPLNGTSQVATFGTIELGAASDTTLSRSAAGIVAVEGVVMKNTGKETIWIPAASMKSRTTNGPAAGSTEQTTNKNMTVSLDFDTTTQEFAQFSIAMPKSWNLSTVTFRPFFSQLTTAAGGVVFGCAGVAVSSGDALDVAFGTAQTSTTTAGTANLEYVGPESSAITIAGTPAAADRIMFQINRTVADGSDTLAQDARLHGVWVHFTTNAATDA